MIPKDKIYHFVIGAIFGIFTIWLPVVAVLIAATFVFFNKEIYDKYKPQPTGFDWWDILADYVGFTVSTLIILLI